MSHPLGPRYHPAAKAQSEKFIVYPPRQTYLLHTRLCQEIIDTLLLLSSSSDDRRGGSGATNRERRGGATEEPEREEDYDQHEEEEEEDGNTTKMMQGSISASLRKRSRKTSSSSPQPLGLSYLLAIGQSPSKSNQNAAVTSESVASLASPSRLSSAAGQGGLKRFSTTPSFVAHRASSSRAGNGRVSSPSSRQSGVTRLPPVGSFAFHGAALGTINATIPYDASASGAIAAIFDQIGYSARPVEDFVLFQTFADYSPDYSTVPMFGEGQPVRLAMKFPYYALVTISPFVRERDRVVESLEPIARAKIENERSAFRSFAHGYAQILHNMAKAYKSLFENELRTRALKKTQERQHFFTVSLFQLLGGESKERYGFKYEERCAWERLMVEWTATREHQLFGEGLLRDFASEREAMIKLHRRGVFEIALLKNLQDRMTKLRSALEEHLSDYCATSRNLYTESRLVGNFLASTEVGLHETDFLLLRRAAARDRNPHLYPSNTTTLVNPLTINTDVFSCTRYAHHNNGGGKKFPKLAVQREQEAGSDAVADSHNRGDDNDGNENAHLCVTTRMILNSPKGIEEFADPSDRRRGKGDKVMYAAAAAKAARHVQQSDDAESGTPLRRNGVGTDLNSQPKRHHILLPSDYARGHAR